MRLNYLDMPLPMILNNTSGRGGSSTLPPSAYSNGTSDFSSVLSSAMADKDKTKLREACQDMEAIFINKMFECMRATIDYSSFTEKSFATETFESMLYEQYSKDMSKTGQVGLADILYKQLEPALSEQ